MSFQNVGLFLLDWLSIKSIQIIATTFMFLLFFLNWLIYQHLNFSSDRVVDCMSAFFFVSQTLIPGMVVFDRVRVHFKDLVGRFFSGKVRFRPACVVFDMLLLRMGFCYLTDKTIYFRLVYHFIHHIKNIDLYTINTSASKKKIGYKFIETSLLDKKFW